VGFALCLLLDKVVELLEVGHPGLNSLCSQLHCAKYSISAAFRVVICKMWMAPCISQGSWKSSAEKSPEEKGEMREDHGCSPQGLSLSICILFFPENMVRGLDEDETNFLDEVSRQQELLEKQRREEEMKELNEYRISFAYRAGVLILGVWSLDCSFSLSFTSLL